MFNVFKDSRYSKVLLKQHMAIFFTEDFIVFIQCNYFKNKHLFVFG